MPSLSEIVAGLRGAGYTVVHEEADQAVVAFAADRGTRFALLETDHWIHVAGVLMEAGDLEKTPHKYALAEAALRIHSRFLGCRVGYDEDMSLVLQCDVYSLCRNVEYVDAVLEQMDYVGRSILPVLERVLRTGNVPSDADLDLAFSV